MVVIDAQKDTVGSKSKWILDLLLGFGGGGGGGQEEGEMPSANNCDVLSAGGDLARDDLSESSSNVNSVGRAEDTGRLKKGVREDGRGRNDREGEAKEHGGRECKNGVEAFADHGCDSVAARNKRAGRQLPLCDPALSVHPLWIRKVRLSKSRSCSMFFTLLLGE